MCRDAAGSRARPVAASPDVKGDKSAEQSVTNALAALKQSGTVAHQTSSACLPSSTTTFAADTRITSSSHRPAQARKALFTRHILWNESCAGIVGQPEAESDAAPSADGPWCFSRFAAGREVPRRAPGVRGGFRSPPPECNNGGRGVAEFQWAIHRPFRDPADSQSGCVMPLTLFALPSEAAAAACRVRQRPRARFRCHAPSAVAGTAPGMAGVFGPCLRLVASRRGPGRLRHRATARSHESIKPPPRRDVARCAFAGRPPGQRDYRAAAHGPPPGGDVGPSGRDAGKATSTVNAVHHNRPARKPHEENLSRTLAATGLDAASAACHYPSALRNMAAARNCAATSRDDCGLVTGGTAVRRLLRAREPAASCSSPPPRCPASPHGTAARRKVSARILFSRCSG